MTNKAICLLLLGSLAACSAGSSGEPASAVAVSADSSATVTGTLTYRERIALPPGSVAEVWLLDTSRADVPATEIAYQEIRNLPSPPIPFVLEYDPAKISDGMQYSVRATIRHADQLLFTSDTHHPVLTRGAGDTADVLLVMIDRDR